MHIVPSASGAHPYKLASLTPEILTSFSSITHEESLRINANDNSGWSSKNCLTCKNAKYFTIRINGELVTCECNCREQGMLARLMHRGNIGDTFQRYGWDHVTGVQPEALTEVLDYMENAQPYIDSGIGMILWSPNTGTGKTLISSLILKTALSLGQSVYSTSFIEMLDERMDSWGDKDARDRFVRHIMNIGVLLVDELGKENAAKTRVIDELLDLVVRARVAHGRPTLITTNLNPTDREGTKGFVRYQSGFLDLLRERTVMVDMTGADFRQSYLTRLRKDAVDGVRYPVVVG